MTAAALLGALPPESCALYNYLCQLMCMACVIYQARVMLQGAPRDAGHAHLQLLPLLGERQQCTRTQLEWRAG